MKPARPPIRAYGNAIVYQVDRQSQEQRTMVRAQSGAPQGITQIPQRGHSPTVISVQRPPQQEPQKYQNFQISHSVYTQPQSPQDPNKKDQIIRQQQEQIQRLQAQLAEKVHQSQLQQEKYNSDIKRFQEEVLGELRKIDLNIEQNDYTDMFMRDIERKAGNLQNHITEQIKEFEIQIENKTKLMTQQHKNLQMNTQIRLHEGEAHFKGEIELLQKVVHTKIDKQQADQLIQSHYSVLANQYAVQLQTAQQLLQKINTDKTDEIVLLKQQLQATLDQLNQSVHSQLNSMCEWVHQQQQQQQQSSQDKKALLSQLNSLTNKFQTLQQAFEEKSQQYQNKIRTLEQELKQQPINSPVPKQNSFFSSSTNCGLPLQIKSQKPKRGNERASQKGLSIDDFPEFNENSINESGDSLDLNETCGFQQRLLASNDFQSPPRNPFSSSSALKMIDENIPRSNKQQRNRSAPQGSALTRAIKRRQLYLGKEKQPLRCTYSPGQHLADIEMGLYLLDDNGNPFQVTNKEKDELISQCLIQIVN